MLTYGRGDYPSSYTLRSREMRQPSRLVARQVRRYIVRSRFTSGQQSPSIQSSLGTEHVSGTELAALHCQQPSVHPSVPRWEGTIASGGRTTLLGWGQHLFGLGSSGACPVTKCAVAPGAGTPVLFASLALSKERVFGPAVAKKGLPEMLLATALLPVNEQT